MTTDEQVARVLDTVGPFYDPNRDVIRQGRHYAKHVMAMTTERLHSKADIAQELAHRDILIEKLRDERDALRAKPPAATEHARMLAMYEPRDAGPTAFAGRSTLRNRDEEERN